MKADGVSSCRARTLTIAVFWLVALPAETHLTSQDRLPDEAHHRVRSSASVMVPDARRSYVGNRSDAIEALQFAKDGKVKCVFKTLPLKELPNVRRRSRGRKCGGRPLTRVGNRTSPSRARPR